MDDEAAVNLRLPTDLRARVQERAQRNERSLSAEIRFILRGAVEPKATEYHVEAELHAK